jgi:cellulose synthase/poly-beta-1,6-N-acetylglucosamine synthase-like glycosyltransferase
VGQFGAEGVELFAFKPNRGKASALNDAMRDIDSEIVVFSDANVMYDSQALRRLARNFGDSRVGGVSGKVVLLNEDVSYGPSENGYYAIEHFIQEMEGRTGTMAGADGAMYAVRRDLFLPLPGDTILDDFAVSMNVIKQGYLFVHEREAVGFEKNSEEISGEFRRKVRINAGGIQYLMHQGLPKGNHRLILFKLISHKVLRWFSGPMMVGLIASSVAVPVSTGFALWGRLFLIGVLSGIELALLGQRFPSLRKRIKLINRVHYFFMLNLASLMGCYKGLTRKQQVTWRAAQASGRV